MGESAERSRDTLACVIDDGVEQITYAELDEQSNTLAHGLLASLGLTEGDTVAVILGETAIRPRSHGGRRCEAECT